MKKLAWLGIAFAGVAAFAWFYARPKWTTKIEQEQRQKQNALFTEGNVANLPGPTTEPGNPRDLKFEKIDLGIGEIISTSEKGDILYRYFGDKPLAAPGKDADGFERTYLKLPKAIYRLRRQNGTIQDFGYPEVEEDIQLVRSGALIQLDRKLPLKIRKDGVLVYTAPFHSSSDHQSLDYVSSPHFTDDLVLSGIGKSYAIRSDKNRFDVQLIDNGDSAYNCQSSSRLGSVYQLGSTSEVILLKDGKQKKIQLPSREFGMMGSPSAIYFNFSTGISIPPQKYDGATLQPVPHPKDVVDFNVLSANSRNDLLATAEKIEPTLRKEGVSYPYQYDHFYISHNKSYLLSDICESLGLYGNNQFFSRYTNTLFEDGSFAIECPDEDFKHVFILRRMS